MANPFFTSNNPPSGLNRADGSLVDAAGNPVGTPSPGALIVDTPDGQSSNTTVNVPLNEYPNSPQVDSGEQITIRHTYECSPAYANQLLYNLRRGTMRKTTTGDIETISKILSVSSSYVKGNTCRLETVEEVMNWSTPPEQFRVEAIELNPDARKHIRYNVLWRNSQDMVAINSYVGGATSYTTAAAAAAFSAIGNNDPSINLENNGQIRLAAALELAKKLFRGENTFYLAGFKVTWSHYFYFQPPGLSPGGYLEDPITQGNLPGYFWSTDPNVVFGSDIPNPNSDANVFQSFARLNPQFYSANGDTDGRVAISWLRLADTSTFERTWFRIDTSWIGAPAGVSGNNGSFGQWDIQWFGKDPKTGQPNPYDDETKWPPSVAVYPPTENF